MSGRKQRRRLRHWLEAALRMDLGPIEYEKARYVEGARTFSDFCENIDWELKREGNPYIKSIPGRLPTKPPRASADSGLSATPPRDPTKPCPW